MRAHTQTTHIELDRFYYVRDKKCYGRMPTGEKPFVRRRKEFSKDPSTFK